jgi:hypothetical protein
LLPLQASPETFDLAREILLRENRTLNALKSDCHITDAKLRDLENNQGAQDKYSLLLKMLQNGGKDATLATANLLIMSPYVYAGFLVFRRKYIEEKFQLKFISPQEDN